MTKSFAPTYEAMEASLARALGEMRLERIDIFLLHQQESEHTLRGHGGALEALAKAKRDGRIRAAGLSTHHVAAVRAATACPDVDVVFALLNVRGLGIQDGTAREMEEALREAHDGGKGVILMKALAGGHLYREAREAMEYVRGRPWVHSVCVGMRSAGEIDANIALMTGSEVGDDTLGALCAGARRVVIDDCRGCGRCVEACGASALSLVDGRASCDHERCVLCGYCARACPEFSIEVV